MYLKVVTGIILAVGLSACVSPYVAKPYDRAAAGVTSIAVADDAAPEKAVAHEVASIGSNFGLIGALVDAGIQQSRTDAVNNALTGAGFDAEAKLESQLVSALAADGYKVKALDGAPRVKRAFLTTYPADAQGVDAYLDVVVNGFGYLSAGSGQPFRPVVDCTVRLVSAKDHSKVLMENIIVYNGLAPRQGVITLTPNPEYAFNNRGEMLADPKRLAAGLEDALVKVADTAAQLLK